MARSILEVQELLELVLSFVNDGGDRDKRLATLSAAARVNSRWLPLALDYMWSEITLWHIFRFLRFETNTYFIPCAGCQNEKLQAMRVRATRFNEVYAPRIRSLFLNLKSFHACSHILEVLEPFPVLNTPKLETLKVNIHPSQYNWELTKKFFHPRLRRLSCKICKSLKSGRYPDAYEIAETLNVLWLAKTITHFRLRLSMSRPIPPDVFEALFDMPSLIEVDLPPYLLTAHHVISLANHSSLRRITCVTQPTREPRGGKYSLDDSTPMDFPPTVFASPTSVLTHLSVTATTFVAAQLITGGFQPDILQSVSVMLKAVEPPENVLELTRALSKTCRNLKSFRLTSPEYHRAWTGDDPSMLWTSLRPLCACSSMEDFEVFWYTFVRLDNADMKELASSWPRLRRLVLDAPQFAAVEIDFQTYCPSFDSLLFLAQHCPSLQTLSLFLRLSLDLPDERPPRRPPLFPHLQNVFFLIGNPHAPAAEPGAIAQLLRDSLPEGCTTLRYWTCPPSASAGDTAAARALWKAVVVALAGAPFKLQNIGMFYTPRYK